MRLIVELPDSKEAVLRARAQAQGLSPEQLAEQILNRELEEPSAPGQVTSHRHIAEEICEIMSHVPSDVFECLPRDGASEVDHYIYGTPKRNQ